MSYRIEVSSYFSRSAKKLSKKYTSFKQDLIDFRNSLLNNPLQGVEISPGVRKIRLAIKSKGKGKSGGARVITYTVVAKETNDGRIFLLLIYDKDEASNIRKDVISDILSEFDL